MHRTSGNEQGGVNFYGLNCVLAASRLLIYWLQVNRDLGGGDRGVERMGTRLRIELVSEGIIH